MADTRFDDALLWSPAAVEALDLGGALLRSRFRGLALRAPAMVSMAERSTVPAAIWQVDSLRDLATHDLAGRGLVVIVDRRSGEVRVGGLRHPEAVREADDLLPHGVSVRPKPPEGEAVNQAFYDLVTRAGFPWQAGDYLVTVVLLDRVSNRVEVALRSSAASDVFHDPAVEALLAAEYARLGPDPVWPLPGNPAPSYRPQPQRPAAPEAPGITLSVDRAVPQRAGARWWLHGAWRLPLRPQDIVRDADASVEHMVARGHGRPTAVMPVTLLLTGTDSPRHVVAELALPSFDPVDPSAPPAEVTGHFTLDLADLLGARLAPQTWFVYAFSRDVMAGPAQTALVSADLLPVR